MRARTLEDGSIAFTEKTHRVVFAFRYRRLVIEPLGGDPHEASTIRTWPFDAIMQLVVHRSEARSDLALHLKGGETINVSAHDDPERVLRLAFAIGNAVRCGIEIETDDASPLARTAIEAELVDLDEAVLA